MLPAPAQDPKDHKSLMGPQSRLWVLCWEHAGAAARVILAPWS